MHVLGVYASRFRLLVKSIAGNSTSCLDLSVLIISTLLENASLPSFKLQWLGVVCNSLGICLGSDHCKGRKKMVAAVSELGFLSTILVLYSDICAVMVAGCCHTVGPVPYNKYKFLKNKEGQKHTRNPPL